MLAGERGIYPIDSVLAVCEVKSRLMAKHYRQIVKTAGYFQPPAGSINGHPDGLAIATPFKNGLCGHWPLFAVFAYESNAKDKSEPERLRQKMRTPHDARTVQLITVLNWGSGLTWARAFRRHPTRATSGRYFLFTCSIGLRTRRRAVELSDCRSGYRREIVTNEDRPARTCRSGSRYPCVRTPPRYRGGLHQAAGR